MNTPLAYHITFGTYGTRLHGDDRGTVDRDHNVPGEPILGPNAARQQHERSLLRFRAVLLTDERRRFIEATLPDIRERGTWGYHIAAAGRDHVHVLLSAEAHGGRVRALLKRWLGQALSERWPLPAGATWWAEGGSIKWVWDRRYFRRAFDYIAEQRATEG